MEYIESVGLQTKLFKTKEGTYEFCRSVDCRISWLTNDTIHYSPSYVIKSDDTKTWDDNGIHYIKDIIQWTYTFGLLSKTGYVFLPDDLVKYVISQYKMPLLHREYKRNKVLQTSSINLVTDGPYETVDKCWLDDDNETRYYKTVDGAVYVTDGDSGLYRHEGGYSLLEMIYINVILDDMVCFEFHYYDKRVVDEINALPDNLVSACFKQLIYYQRDSL